MFAGGAGRNEAAAPLAQRPHTLPATSSFRCRVDLPGMYLLDKTKTDRFGTRLRRAMRQISEVWTGRALQTSSGSADAAHWQLSRCRYHSVLKLIFVNRFFHPDLSATSQMLSDLAFGLAVCGHEVHVVCSRQLYEDPAARLPEQELVQGVHIHRAWSTRFGRRSLIGRAADYLSFYLGALVALRRCVTPNSILVVKTDPPLMSVPAGWLTRQRGAFFVNWLQDVFPEVAEQAGLGWARGRLGEALKRLRDRSLRRAAANVVIGERMRELLLQRGIAPDLLSVIPNWSDPEVVIPVPAEQNPLVAEWSLQNRFVVMYSGNMGRAHDFDTILEAARLLSDDPRVVFLFVGGGARKRDVEEAVRQRGLDNVHFHPYQPKERLAQSLGVGAVHLISLSPDQEGLIVPSKFYGILAAGRPAIFVGDLDGEIARLVHRHDVGAAVAQGDGPGLASLLQRLLADDVARDRMGMKARALLMDRYTKEKACAAWGDVLRKI